MNKIIRHFKITLITVLCLILSLLFVACGEPGEKGDKGDKGDTGAAGVGIVSIVKDSTNGNIDTYKITMSNGNTSTFIVTNGTNGSDGQNGQDGADGISVTNAQIVDGELILSFSQGNSINLGKVVGDDGQNGTNGTDGKDGVGIKGIVLSNEGELTITLTNDTPINLGNVKGNNGKSAYEMYKEKNPAYTGDEDQWMSDLVNGKLSTVQVTQYTVTFDSNGGTPIDPQQVEEGKKVIQPDNPTRDGYTFLGWYTGKYGDEKWVFSGYPVTEQTTLTAKWVENIYTITFNSNGGNAIEPIEIKYNQQITLPVAIRDDFAFAGWLQNGQLVDETIVITGDVTLTAKWVAPTYDITFDINGGDSNVEPITYNYGEAYLLPIPTKTGSEFAGWFVGEQQITDGIWKFEENMTLVAEWTAIPYTISFESWIHASYGIDLDDLTVYYNQPYELPKLDTFEDCQFDCWLNSKGEIAESGVWKNTESITLTAKWIYLSELFDFEISSNKAIITNYIGNDKDVVVPKSIGGLKVIVSQATFQNNELVESIEFDADYIAFQDRMFNGCKNLKKITISSDWSGNITTLFGDSEEDIPDCFSIVEHAAGGNSSGEIFIPDNIRFIFASDITEITESIAQKIDSKNIEIPSNVVIIKNRAFLSTYNVENIFFSANSNLKTIGESAFASLPLSNNILIPNSVTEIRQLAFYNCTKLKAITFEENSKLSGIGDRAFGRCISLETVMFGANSQLASIGGYTFESCSSLTSIDIPAGVTSIKYGAFAGCESIKNVYITDLAAWCNISFRISSANPMYYGADLYLNGTRITDLEIPTGIKTIGYQFTGCTSISSVIIPVGVTNIGNDAFNGCSGIIRIEISSSVTDIGGGAFKNCNIIKSVNITDLTGWCNISFGDSYSNPMCYGADLYLNGTKVKELAIPTGIKEIKNYIFYGCASITSVTIPASVISIGASALRDCNSLVSIEMPLNVTSIGSYAFNGCNGLTSIIIPSNVTNIGLSVFGGCNSLIIYCEATSKPSGWDDTWNNSNCPVYWGV